MSRVIARELEVLGAHGMAAHAYPQLLAAVLGGRLDPAALVTRVVGLREAPAALVAMGEPGSSAGVTVVDPRRP
jgi:alcohol dehydrogenase